MPPRHRFQSPTPSRSGRMLLLARSSHRDGRRRSQGRLRDDAKPAESPTYLHRPMDAHSPAAHKLHDLSIVICYVGVQMCHWWHEVKLWHRIITTSNNCCCGEETLMPCIEMMELEASYARYNERSLITTTLLSSGRGEFSKWHRAGRAKIAWSIQMHRQTCGVCRSQG
jgi:hypothetical protein